MTVGTGGFQGAQTPADRRASFDVKKQLETLEKADAANLQAAKDYAAAQDMLREIVMQVFVEGLFDRLQVGKAFTTSDANGDSSVTFPKPFAEEPVVVPVRRATSTSERTLSLVSVSTTGFTVRAFNGGSLAPSQPFDFHWFAFGELA